MKADPQAGLGKMKISVHLLRSLYTAIHSLSRARICTGKSFSEALILASTNPQYGKRLFIELQVQYMKTTSSVHDVYTNYSECQNKNKQQFVYNMYGTWCFPVSVDLRVSRISGTSSICRADFINLTLKSTDTGVFLY